MVTEDTHKLEGDLGPSDRRKLDEYLSSIREIEHQIERAEKDNAQLSPGTWINLTGFRPISASTIS